MCECTMHRRLRGAGLFAVALCLRVAAVVPATLQITTHSRQDPVTFARVAEFVAMGLQEGVLQYPEVSRTIHVLGTFLSPFWLLPGPSAVYARIALAICGAIVVYNVFAIGRAYHSHRAGVYAA